MIENIEISIIIACLILSAFFSGMEIAFISADKLVIELQNQKGSLVGKILAYFQKHRAHFLATTLTGNNISLVVFGIFMAGILEPWLQDLLPEWLASPAVVLVVQSILSTLIVLFTAEFLPKSLFLINPNFMLNTFSIPMFVIYVILFILVFLIVIISKFIITKIFGVEYSEEKPVFGLVDLNNYIKSSLKSAEEQDESEIDPKIFNNALEFKEVKVRECMIPRTEIVAVDVEDDISELKKEFISSGHSKIVVYKDSIDDVIGYCHSLELFKKPDSIKKILTPINIVPETMPANELMIQFINERRSLALVVDEFGGTSGIVSMEDVIEEIFGEIRDEHDDDYLIEEKLSDNIFVLSARQEIDYLNDKYQWELPEGEYDTLGGLILNINENIPEVNEVISADKFRFTVLTMEDNRIDKVQMEITTSDL